MYDNNMTSNQHLSHVFFQLFYVSLFSLASFVKHFDVEIVLAPRYNMRSNFSQILWSNIAWLCLPHFQMYSQIENKMYIQLNNDCEICLQLSSMVQHCPLEIIFLLEMQFKFKSIKEIKSSDVISIVDIIDIATNTSPTSPID